MPGFEMVIEAPTGRKSVARCYLRTPGYWSDLSEAEKAAWNKVTAAVRELFELYTPPEITETEKR